MQHDTQKLHGRCDFFRMSLRHRQKRRQSAVNVKLAYVGFSGVDQVAENGTDDSQHGHHASVVERAFAIGE